MRDLRRINVLLNETTGEEFHKGDIVKITVSGSYNKDISYIGKLHWIETLELTIDMSKEYESDQRKFKFEEILKVEKVS